LPSALEAELYQALTLLPGVQVDSHVTAIDGQAGIAFIMPPTPQSVEQEIILNPSTYAYLAWASKGADGAKVEFEQAILQTVIVGAPGSTQPSLTPPTAAELLAERADAAATPSPVITWWSPNLLPGSWILRELATSSGKQTVWATADDSEQASYVNGRLQVCSRSAACAASTKWLMPAGPGCHSSLLGEGSASRQPAHVPAGTARGAQLLPHGMRRRSARLQRRQRDRRHGHRLRQRHRSATQLVPAPSRHPGVTIAHVTDVTGQADIAFRFPFTDGVTEILFNASTYRLVGYARNGTETVITKEIAVHERAAIRPVRAIHLAASSNRQAAQEAPATYSVTGAS
jgi:hypothetical protein